MNRFLLGPAFPTGDLLTHKQTFARHSSLPNFGRSFISALWPLLAPDPAVSNVVMWWQAECLISAGATGYSVKPLTIVDLASPSP